MLEQERQQKREEEGPAKKTREAGERDEAAAITGMERIPERECPVPGDGEDKILRMQDDSEMVEIQRLEISMNANIGQEHPTLPPPPPLNYSSIA